MPPLHRLFARSLSLILALLISMPTAWAQWAWRDASGTVQYSDTPPPSSVPQERIVRQPGGSASSQSGPAASSGPATPAWVEQNAEFVKRREQRQEQEKKEKEKQHVAAQNRKNCAAARENLRILESVGPIRQATEQGDIALMNDNQRNAEIARMRDFLKNCG